MRVLSLVAGIALLVTALASTVGRRADVGAARDGRLEATADLLAEQFDATVGRATAALGVATTGTPIERIADAAGLPVCAVVAGRRACTRDVERLVPDASFDAVLAAARNESGSVAMVVPDTLHLAVAIDQGERQLVVVADLATEDLPVDTAAVLVPVADEPLLTARTVDGTRVFATPLLVEFEGGPWAVRTSTPADVRLTAGERWLYGAQMAIGAALALFALGGMIAEHRSLQRRATTDALTQLPNRDEFTRRASEVLVRLARERATACLLLIDLDQFKVVNDTVGHEAGDRALVAAAERLRQAVRETDVVGRWGGDEFVVLMPGIVDARAVPMRAAAIANAIAAAPPIAGFELTASVGAALYPAHGTDLEALLRAADRAMYAAKVQGVAHHLAEGV